MKSERRHELEKNELADWLGGVVARIKPYQNLILGTAVVALVVVLIYAWSARYSEARAREGWNEFSEAFALGAGGADFEQIAEQYPDSELGHWAGVMAGDFYLASGCEQLFVNKADAFRDLKKAAEHYTHVLEKSRHSMIRERATYGLARAREAMARDKKDVEAAAKEYEKVFTNWPDGAFARIARQRFDSLQRDSAVEVYERFASFEPKPAFRDEPGIPGQRPAFDLDALPDDAPLFTPSLDLGGPSAELPGTEAEPGGEGVPPLLEIPPDLDVPAAPDAKPAAEPEEASPEDAKPAAPAEEEAPAPADEAPTDEGPAENAAAAEEPPVVEEPALEPPAAQDGESAARDEASADTPPAAEPGSGEAVGEDGK